MKRLARLAFLCALLVLLVLVMGLRQVPCPDPLFLHDGSELQQVVYSGKGAYRQVVVFCIHINEELGYAQTPVHMLYVVDDPVADDPVVDAPEPHP